MGGVVKSIGGFLGTSSGPDIKADTQNAALQQMQQNQVEANTPGMSQLSQQIASGQVSGLQGLQQTDSINQQNDLATNAITGSQVAQGLLNQNQPYQNTMAQGQQQIGQANHLFGQAGDVYQNALGQVGNAEGRLDNLENQGFNLTPGDNTLYGQESGNIARQFGQQGNQAASDLAMRGLSSSGAAGATFSGLAGSQNEMLANAQQQIAQQRFQNTMGQISQQQNFINSMMGQGNQATSEGNAANQSAANINQNLGNYAGQQLQNQYGRQLAGAQAYNNNLAQTAGQTASSNNSNNQANLAASGFNAANTPANFGDFLGAGIGSSVQNIAAAPGKLASSVAGSAGSGLFAAGA
jgi:hypothetical protein